MIFGSDSYADCDNVKWVADWWSRDRAILESIGLDEKQTGKYFGENLRRFVSEGISTENRKSPLVGN